MVSKSFACEHVAEVHFDERHGHCEKGVAQGDTGVRIARWIDDHERNTLVLRGMNLRNQLVLGVALESRQGMATTPGEPPELGLDALQIGGTVYLGLAEPQEI